MASLPLQGRPGARYFIRNIIYGFNSIPFPRHCRIYHWLKFIMAVVCLLFYGFFIVSGASLNEKYGNVFNTEYFGYDELVDDEHRQWSHFIFICICALFFWMMDRQVRRNCILGIYSRWCSKIRLFRNFFGVFNSRTSRLRRKSC